MPKSEARFWRLGRSDVLVPCCSAPLRLAAAAYAGDARTLRDLLSASADTAADSSGRNTTIALARWLPLESAGGGSARGFTALVPGSALLSGIWAPFSGIWVPSATALGIAAGRDRTTSAKARRDPCPTPAIIFRSRNIHESVLFSGFPHAGAAGGRGEPELGLEGWPGRVPHGCAPIRLPTAYPPTHLPTTHAASAPARCAAPGVSVLSDMTNILSGLGVVFLRFPQ